MTAIAPALLGMDALTRSVGQAGQTGRYTHQVLRILAHADTTKVQRLMTFSFDRRDFAHPGNDCVEISRGHSAVLDVLRCFLDVIGGYC